MHSADAGAGKHGIGRLGDHRHVDGDAVALLDAVGQEHVCQPADMAVKLAVGDFLVVVWIVALPDDGGLVAALFQMAVDAVDAHIEDAVFEPFDRDVGIGVADFLDLGRRLEPVEALGLLTPECVRIHDRVGIHLLVAVIVHIGTLLPLGRNCMNLNFGHGPDTSPLNFCNST